VAAVEEAAEAEMTRRDFKHHPQARFKNLARMTQNEARTEAEALREGIEHHNELYFVKDQPKISDALYDKLFARLQAIEAKFPTLQTASSPTQRVGARPVGKLNRTEHAAPMLSLHSVTRQDDIAGFDDFVKHQAGSRTVQYFLDPKFDGVSVELVYEHGRFVRGATRGDGQMGEDISTNLKTIKDVPARLRSKRTVKFLSVRGEAYIPTDAFQRMNKARIERNEEPLANPRNAAAGILRRLEPEVVAQWPLKVVVYDVLKVEGAKLTTQQETWKQLQRWGLKASTPAQRAKSLDAVVKFHQRLERQRDSLPVEIDGVVVKLDDLALAEKLGTRHRSPRGAIAWKFAPREEVTTLEEIVVQVGRTGVLTPVALLAPVDVGGVTVSRATLHNEREVLRKDVRPGDKVRIARAGDVIPEVVERVKTTRRRGKSFSMPRKCPSCGAKVVQEGANSFCPAGLTCSAQLVACVTHYASRDALDIAGLGEETVRQLADRGLVKDVADLYALTISDLKSLAAFATRSAEKLHKAIQDSKHPRLDRFLYALGIRHVGERTARVLARRFGSLDKLRDANEYQIARAAGAVAAHRVQQFFDDAAIQRVLQRLQKAGVKPEEAPVRKQRQTLAGKTFVFTGTLSDMTREEAQEAVEARGGKAASSVSSRTDFVVAGESPGSKLDQAHRKGVSVLTKSEFQKKLA
jgi:DNA ligase (NAD+)